MDMDEATEKAQATRFPHARVDMTIFFFSYSYSLILILSKGVEKYEEQ